MLEQWDTARAQFVKVFPNEYVRALSELYVKAQQTRPAGVPAERAAA
jgi:glutamate synthase (NADPH/NADH) large chain/glutamate synthase (ferredoxin)